MADQTGNQNQHETPSGRPGKKGDEDRAVEAEKQRQRGQTPDGAPVGQDVNNFSK